ncbi:MAG: AI-2E family transporter [Chloroflexi bacterium]|nr:AI-2E family transporter [Chloroflexota bacterium]MCI0580985.1 AI-2E family transporter [Chloroflexota bacterium]MCI0646324.1 AI-2E family transporter [Chloroflexota bacterium]MCI0726978.1 AI-2E family transporter [Chloroflexota bacterium]
MSSQWSITTRVIVAILILFVLGLFFYLVRPLLWPLTIACLAAYVLNPTVRFVQQRTNLSRKWSVSLVYFFLLIILIATPGTLVPVVARQARTLSSDLLIVQRDIESLLNEPVVILGRPIVLSQIWTNVFGASDESLAPAAESALTVIETTSISLIWLLIILVTTYYLLMDWVGLRDWLVNLAPEGGREDIRRLLEEINVLWLAYVRGTLALMLIMGVVFVIVGVAIGLPGAVALGILTGLLSMIPELGPVIAGTVAVLVALLEGSVFLPLSNFWFAVLVAGIYLVLTQIKSLWLRPHVMGRFLHMNTGLVFLAIISAAVLQGILGALIILPIMATCGVIGRYVRARLLGLDPWPEPAAEAPVTEVAGAPGGEELPPPLAPSVEQGD